MKKIKRNNKFRFSKDGKEERINIFGFGKIFDIYNSQEISRQYNIHLRSFVRDIHSYFIALRSIPPYGYGLIAETWGTRVSTRVRKYADMRVHQEQNLSREESLFGTTTVFH